MCRQVIQFLNRHLKQAGKIRAHEREDLNNALHTDGLAFGEASLASLVLVSAGFTLDSELRVQAISPRTCCSEGHSVKPLATAKEAVANGQAEISQEAGAQARAGARRFRARENGGPEQPDIRQRPADRRPRHSRVRRLVPPEPRLAFNRTVVLQYRIHLEQRGYAPATINLRLAAIRRVS